MSFFIVPSSRWRANHTPESRRGAGGTRVLVAPPSSDSRGAGSLACPTASTERAVRKGIGKTATL